MKLVPGAEKAGGRYSRGQEQSGVIRNTGLGGPASLSVQPRLAAS